jgi:hypothetical protein
MEPESSLQHSQQPATCPYPEPDQSSACPPPSPPPTPNSKLFFYVEPLVSVLKSELTAICKLSKVNSS